MYQGVVNFVASESMKPMKIATRIASPIEFSPSLKFLAMMVKGPALVFDEEESGTNWEC